MEMEVPEFMRNAPAVLDVSCARSFDAEPELVEKLQDDLHAGRVLAEAGCELTDDVARCKSFLGLLVPWTERKMAEMIGFLCCVNMKVDGVRDDYESLSTVLRLPVSAEQAVQLTAWNHQVLTDAIRELAPGLRCASVISHLDHEGFFVPDHTALHVILMYHSSLCGCRGSLDKCSVLKSIWRNTEGQLSLLREMVVAHPDYFKFKVPSKTQFLKDERFVSASPNNAWFSVELIETLCLLAESGQFEHVKRLLKDPAQRCPELLLAGLAQAKTAWPVIRNEYFFVLFAKVVKNNPAMLSEMWELNSEAVKLALVEMHSEDPDQLVEMLHRCFEEMIPSFLHGTPFRFSVELATLLSKREQIMWLSDQLATHNDTFFQACLKFLHDVKIRHGENAKVHVKRAYNFAKELHRLSGELGSQELELLSGELDSKELQEMLLPLATTVKATDKKLEEVALACVKRLFDGKIALHEFLQIMKRLRTSSLSRKRVLYWHLIDAVVDEYRFIKSYSLTQVQTVGRLFGQILRDNLGTSSKSTALLLRSVLASLRDKLNAKSSEFGLVALNEFIDRLEEFPGLCGYLFRQKHIKTVRPDLFKRVEAAYSATVLKLTQGSPSDRKLSIKTLLEEANERDAPALARIPNEERVLFILNNLMPSNVEEKAKEILKIIPEDCYPWLAQHIVMKRASREVNRHDMYIRFLEQINSRALNDGTLKETYQNCKALLDSDLIRTVPEERLLLENMGSWLGKLTISKDKCLKAKEIDLKPLVIEAYKKGLMIAILPFVSKVLESCRESKAYRPPNPWTMGILSLLGEVYERPNLKLNVVSEIERIFKHLNVKIYDVTPTAVLKDIISNVEGNSDFRACKPHVPTTTPHAANGLNQTLMECGKYVVINPHIPDDLGCQLRSIVIQAFEDALTNVKLVDSATKTASKTTRTLVLKDYAFENDDRRSVEAFKSMLSGLTSLVAYVSVKDQLRERLVSCVGSLLAGLTAERLPSAEDIVNDNMHIGRIILEKMAVEQARQGFEAKVKDLSMLRKSVRDGLWRACKRTLPEALLPGPGRLSDSHQRIFKEFNRLRIEEQAREWLFVPASHPPALVQTVTALFDEWINVYKASSRSYSIVNKIYDAGLLEGNLNTYRFLSILTELALYCSSNPEIDAYTSLIHVLVTFKFGDSMCHIDLLDMVLKVTAWFIQHEAREKKEMFQPQLFFRLFSMWLVSFRIVPGFCPAMSKLLNMVQPLNVPGFSFAWLELVTHRLFMPTLLETREKWPLMEQLLVAHLKFLEPHLRSCKLPEAIRKLYDGTIRVLAVILHDFPEFFSEYYFTFCDVIAPNCTQMRNIILSATPRQVVLSTQLLPRILSDVDGELRNAQLKEDLCHYLTTQQSDFLPHDLPKLLLLPEDDVSEYETRYNVPLINSLVLYIVIHGENGLCTYAAQWNIFYYLIQTLDAEARYYLLSAMVNQLRYANYHTTFFSHMLCQLFETLSKESIGEQIVRVLLERVIAKGPHPWGVLYTLGELFKNPRYRFWSHGFVRCAPEIERNLKEAERYCNNIERCAV